MIITYPYHAVRFKMQLMYLYLIYLQHSNYLYNKKCTLLYLLLIISITVTKKLSLILPMSLDFNF